MCTSLILPVERKTEDGHFLHFPVSADDAQAIGYTANDIATTMFQFWSAFHSLSMAQSPVPLVKGRQYALVLLGHKSHSSGIRPRPWFPCSDMVIKTTSTLLYGKTSWHTNAIWYRHGPLVGFHFPRFVIHQAKKKLNLGQSEARRLKRGRPVLTFRIFAKSVHSSPCLGWEWALQTKGNRET